MGIYKVKNLVLKGTWREKGKVGTAQPEKVVPGNGKKRESRRGCKGKKKRKAFPKRGGTLGKQRGSVQ